MEEQVIKVVNPYERRKQIEEQLSILEKEEQQLKSFISRGMDKRSNSEKLDKNTSEQFYLIIELESLKTAINWFEIYSLGFRKAEELKSEVGNGD